MGAVLDPSVHASYFNEIRSLVSPDHSMSAEELPNSVIDQFAYLGKAEVAVLRAADTTSVALRPAADDAATVPTAAAAIRKRQLVYVVECLTAISLLMPQVIAESNLGDSVTLEQIDKEKRQKELEAEIRPILPAVLSSSDTTTTTTDDVISTVEIEETF